MQELASAYYKVFKYNQDFFDKMVKGTQEAMNHDQAENSWYHLGLWLDKFRDLDRETPLRGRGNVIREAHNDKYQNFVKTMSDKGEYQPDFLDIVAKALIYAAEAYHTRGAIRHVVGGTQKEVVNMATELSTNDLWVSMIENWGETNKEYEHCEEEPVEVCLLKMSKYMWRMFHAMKLVRDDIAAQARPGLVHFTEEAFADPENAMSWWLAYKRDGKTAICTDKNNVTQFLRQFNCGEPVFGRPLSHTCIEKINDKVNAYNIRLAALVTDKPTKQPWRL